MGSIKKFPLTIFNFLIKRFMEIFFYISAKIVKQNNNGPNRAKEIILNVSIVNLINAGQT